jgi:1-acyl-sn-glycerol-3-phosphate acyltransferase
MLPFHEGSFKIATRGKCPIIPIALNNTSQIWESHFPTIKKCHVVIEYGKPIYPEELPKETQKKLGEYTQGIILDMLRKNKDLV